MMTREDVLRELEQLPVWQLRAPLSEKIAAEPTVADKIAAETPPETAQPTAQLFDYFVSENNAWIFICPGSRADTASQSMLFDNILVALQIKAKKYVGDLAASNAKVLVAMGEKTAQSLLKTTDNIESLRGKTHLLHNMPVIVTYSVENMLQHLPNKAKTWDDLCMALNIVNA